MLVDEPADVGGTDLAPSPGQLLRTSLASCTAITLRMYADRKKLDVDEIRVTVSSEKREHNTVFYCAVSLTGNLTEEQRQRLREIAHACPIHKILTNPILIETTLS